MTKEEYLELGLTYIKKKEWEEALGMLRESQKRHAGCVPESLPPDLLAALGLCVAMTENKVLSGLKYCEHAVNQEPFRPDIYYFMGLIYLKERIKREAITCFYRGLRLDPGHPEIISKLRQLGIRKRRSIHFLPRENLMNRLIGKWVA